MHVLAKVLAPLRRCWRPAAVVLLCAAAAVAQAQSAGDDPGVDPPSRVARLSYVSGDLGFLPAGATDWSDASVNRPLTTGDRLSTGPDARAELELGGGTLRMAGQSDFGMLDLNDQLAQVELTQGTLNLTVRSLDQGQSYEIDTPTLALVIDQPGTFRVDVDGNGGGTQVTAFDGGATVYGENNAQRTVNPGRSYRFDDASLNSVAISDVDGGDAFDAWSNDRESHYAQSVTRQYVSDDVVGYQDLDQYGDWQTTSDYGAVWFPRQVAADWAPYRDGHWAYIAPWGWTWVDDSPWGFAPYHYGRWAYVRGGWGWIPGPYGVRSVYAPALVAFVGGGGWSVGIGGGPVGWFPLGPGEIYNPWYRASRGYYTNVNFTNIRGRRGYERDIRSNIDSHYSQYRDGTPGRGEHYANRDAPRGFTAVPGNVFAGGRHVQRDLLHVDQRQLAAAPVLAHGAIMRPTAASFAPSRSARARPLPAGGFQREVVARHAPPVMPMADRAGAGNRPAGARAIGGGASNVRVLGTRDGTDRGASQAGAMRTGNDRLAPINSRQPSDVRTGSPNRLPPASNAATGMRQDNPAPSRPGELPSARFAHPQVDGMGGSDAGRRAPMSSRLPTDSREPAPRSGADYRTDAGGNSSREAGRMTQALPQVPQIQRATPITAPPAPANDERFNTGRAMRDNAPPSSAPSYTRDAPRFERGDNAPRAQPRAPEAMRPEVERQQPAPPMQGPHYQQLQQPQAAPPRPEAGRAAPHGNEPRPAAKPRERPANKDDQQH